MSDIRGGRRVLKPLQILFIFSVCLCVTSLYVTTIYVIEVYPGTNKSIVLKPLLPKHSDVYIDNERLLDRPKINTSTPLITILWINRPSWFPSKDPFHGCPYTNCRMTNKVRNIKSKSAIVFSAQDELSVQLNPRDKPEGQIWIFLRMEPPTRAKHATWFENPIWRNTMNWSWGYKQGSDIFRPYHKLIPRNTYPVKNYSEIFKRKKKVAAWVVSHCETQSRRQEYVQQLKQHGLPVDIFGRCTQGKKQARAILEKKIAKDYKFYLSFENSFCKDFFTEKFFNYYDSDVVSVVRGGMNYSQHFDRTTFINAADFPSAKELAAFILKVNSNEALYTDYLRNKDQYEPISRDDMWQISNCELCKKLNEKERFTKVYDDMHTFLFKDACFPPNDL